MAKIYDINHKWSIGNNKKIDKPPFPPFTKKKGTERGITKYLR